jgi:hypothetical protein
LFGCGFWRAHQRSKAFHDGALPIPRAYIVASNIACRHMSKGQQAMAVAMM